MSDEATSGNGTVSPLAGTAASQPDARHVSVEERRRLVADSLRVGNPGNNSRELPAQADPRHECQLELAVDAIRPYENNPRRAAHARFEQIKESIRSSGIRNPLTVTRRPGEEHFVVESGGNTRLLAIQQLWSETRDARFQKLVVLFRPWRSESHVLSAHLIENELRGEMTFWDKANGLVALKVRLEAGKGQALSLRQLQDEIKALGLSVNTATLAHCLFVTERLRTLGEAVDGLSGLDVKTMQPRLNAMKRYAQTRGAIAEDDLYARVFEPVFRQAADRYRQSQAFSAAQTCRACEEVLASELGEPVTHVRSALDAPARSSQSLPESSPEAGRADRPGQPQAMRPSEPDEPPPPQPAVSTANAPTRESACLVPPWDERPPYDERLVVRLRIIEHAQRFAALAGIGECVHLHADAPAGYLMEALPVADDEAMAPPSRHRAWWLLAVVAGQLDRPASSVVPEGSTGADSASANWEGRTAGHPPKPVAFDAEFFGWLVDAGDEAANACWNLLGLARQLRGLTAPPGAAHRPIPAAGEA